MARKYVFVSYSHVDAEWLDRLLVYLKPYAWARPRRQGGRLWIDPALRVADVWHREIVDGLDKSAVGVILRVPPPLPPVDA
ncbi:MAG: hypothetical protein ACKVS7_02345 [Gemmatimonadaceae bacterium]